MNDPQSPQWGLIMVDNKFEMIEVVIRKQRMTVKAGLKVPPGGFRGGFPGKAGGQQKGIRSKPSGTNSEEGGDTGRSVSVEALRYE